MLRLKFYKLLHFLHILSKEEYKKKSAPYKYRLSPEYKAIAKSKLFDKWWYLEHNPDVTKAGKDPIEHYLKYGWKNEKRQTTPYFDEKKYAEMYPDVKEANVPPLLHYIQFGAPENRQAPLLEYKRPNILVIAKRWFSMQFSAIKTEIINLKTNLTKKEEHSNTKKYAGKSADYVLIATSKYFDEKYYLEKYQDVAKAGVDPINHYMNHGWKEGRNPSKYFDTKFYLNTYGDIKKAGINPLVHYLKHGIKEERLCKPQTSLLNKLKTFCKKNNKPDVSADYKLIAQSKYFDKKWYLKTYPDVARAGIDPIKHYLDRGWKEGRNPSKKFNTNQYMEIYTDIASAKICPLLHYEKHGKLEKRLISTKQIKLDYNIFYLILNVLYKLVIRLNMCEIHYIIGSKTIDNLYKHIKPNISFPLEKDPLVSIIIPVYNQYKYTLTCLHYIKKNTKNISYEIILVDDNSTDETQNISKNIKNITIIKNKKNQGFLLNCNNAVKLAKGKYIVVLNNDIIVTKKWLYYLLNVYQTHANVGAVGGQTIFPTGKIQESGRFVLNNGSSLNKYNNMSIEQFRGKIQKVHYCSGCLLLVKKSLWDRIGGFDKRFVPAYYEDNDLCMSIREKMHKFVFCEPKCKVIHFHNVSYNAKSNQISDINKIKFLNKWKKELEKKEYEIPYSAADITLIKESDYFDEKYYKTTYKIKEDPIKHYLEKGWKLKYNPSELFNTAYYLENNVDVFNSKINPLLHFLKHGETEGRSSNGKMLNKCYNEFRNYVSELKKIKSKKVLLITHSFSLTGAPLAVFHTAKYLKEKGYNVTVIGFDNGDLLAEYDKLDIKTFHGGSYYFANDLLSSLLTVFEFFFANTVLTYKWVRIFPHNAYIWRIAEGEDIYTKFNDALLYKTLRTSKNIYAVSEYTRKILLHFNKNVKLLLYGIEEKESSSKLNNTSKIKYLIIGNYCKRKGQDIVLEIISDLLEQKISNFEFIFMGAGFENFQDTAYTKFIGIKTGQEKYDIIHSSDILLCPSLDDPNPQVVMEGMMMHKPCLITNKVGQKDYITKGENGWIVKAGSANELKKCIINISHLDKKTLRMMGEKSYILFQNYFELNKYMKTVESIIKKGK